MSGVGRHDGWMTIGALTRHVDLERGHDLPRQLSLLPEAAHWIADPLVRNQGTIGGSVCHADPSGDWGSVVLALDADLGARSAKGERVIHAADFFQGPFTTALRPDEVLTEIRVASSSKPSAGAYNKLERKVRDFATVAGALQVQLGGNRGWTRGTGLAPSGP